MGGRRLVTAAFGGAAALLGAAGIAFACTGQPVMQLAGQPMGEAGSKVALNVLASAQLEKAPVSVHWNAINGPILATASLSAEGGKMEVTVPQVGPGVYYLVLDAGEAGVGRAAFEVTAPAGAPAQPSAWDAGERPASRTSGPLTAGMVMLAVGLVGLGGFGLVTAARSRALARRGA